MKSATLRLEKSQGRNYWQSQRCHRLTEGKIKEGSKVSLFRVIIKDICRSVQSAGINSTSIIYEFSKINEKISPSQFHELFNQIFNLVKQI